MRTREIMDYTSLNIRELLEAFEVIDDRQHTDHAINLVSLISRHFQLEAHELDIDHIYPYQVKELVNDEGFAKAVLGDSFDLVMGEIEVMQIKLERVKSAMNHACRVNTTQTYRRQAGGMF